MRKIHLLLLFWSLISFGQKNYVKGYYIDNSGQKVNGLVLFREYFNTPQKFMFKSSENDTEKEIDINYASEVTIVGEVRYKKFAVEYETDMIRNKKEFDIKSPDFFLEKREMFVRVIEEGEINLYNLTLEDVKFYYIQKKGEPEPTLLKYKKYYYVAKESTELSGLTEVNLYRKQLSENLKCDKLNLKNFLAISYKEKDIRDLVNRNNYCNEAFVNYDTIRHKRKVIFTPFIDFTHNTVKYSDFRDLDKFQSQNISVGAEVSVLLSQVNKDFELFTRVSYGKYKLATDEHFTQDVDFGIAYRHYEFNPSLFNLEIGFRYSMIATPKNKLFADLSLGYSIINGELKIYDILVYDSNLNLPDSDYGGFEKASNSLLIQLGLGYEINWRYGIEVKYNPVPNNYFKELDYFKVKHNMLSLSLRYSLFRPKFAE